MLAQFMTAIVAEAVDNVAEGAAVELRNSVAGYNTIALWMLGTSTDVSWTLQGSLDGVTWIALGVEENKDVSSALLNSSIDIFGARYVRFDVTAIANGNISCTLVAWVS